MIQLSKKTMNMIYGLGAAVVIIGALFKIQHFSIGPLTGGVVLSIGLIVEAGVFALSAFEPVDDELDWTKVYPELAGGQSLGNGNKDEAKEAQRMLSQKLDNILNEAKLDVNLISSLGDNIQKLQDVAEGLSSTSSTISLINQYNEQMSMAAAKLESLNELYSAQLDTESDRVELNSMIRDNTQQLQEQMQSLSANLSSLNGVYGGMLSAMSKN